MKPPSGGLIVRTLAEGLTKKSLKADVGYLVRLWGEIAKKRETAARAPDVLYTELDLVLKTARDLFTDDVEEIVIDNRDEYVRRLSELGPVYREVMGRNFPAMTCVQVAALVEARAKIEIEVTAVVPD